MISHVVWSIFSEVFLRAVLMPKKKKNHCCFSKADGFVVSLKMFIDQVNCSLDEDREKKGTQKNSEERKNK